MEKIIYTLSLKGSTSYLDMKVFTFDSISKTVFTNISKTVFTNSNYRSLYEDKVRKHTFSNNMSLNLNLNLYLQIDG